MTNKSVFIDTTAFFGSKEILMAAVLKNWSLNTSVIVIYEFLKVIEEEIALAIQKKREQRIKVLTNIKNRFPQLLNVIEIKILPLALSKDDVPRAMEIMSKYAIDIGDTLNYLIMKQNKILYILTEDKDWNRIEKIKIISQNSFRL